MHAHLHFTYCIFKKMAAQAPLFQREDFLQAQLMSSLQNFVNAIAKLAAEQSAVVNTISNVLKSLVPGPRDMDEDDNVSIFLRCVVRATACDPTWQAKTLQYAAGVGSDRMSARFRKTLDPDAMRDAVFCLFPTIYPRFHEKQHHGKRSIAKDFAQLFYAVAHGQPAGLPTGRLAHRSEVALAVLDIPLTQDMLSSQDSGDGAAADYPAGHPLSSPSVPSVSCAVCSPLLCARILISLSLSLLPTFRSHRPFIVFHPS